MVIRLKLQRRKEEQTNKVRDLMQMFKVPNFPTYQQYQSIGASNISNSQTAINDPRTQATKNLFEMFHLER